jgi:hypothetical protein
MAGRNEDDQENETLGNGHGGGPGEDEHTRFVTEESRSTSMEEDCMGGEGPYQTVAPD